MHIVLRNTYICVVCSITSQEVHIKPAEILKTIPANWNLSIFYIFLCVTKPQVCQTCLVIDKYYCFLNKTSHLKTCLLSWLGESPRQVFGQLSENPSEIFCLEANQNLCKSELAF